MKPLRSPSRADKAGDVDQAPEADPNRPTTPKLAARYDAEHAMLVELLQRHAGVIENMATEMRTTRQNMSLKLHRHGLADDAKEARRTLAEETRSSMPHDRVRVRVAGAATEDDEKARITAALQAAKNNVREAAKALGIGPRMLYRRIKEYEITA